MGFAFSPLDGGLVDGRSSFVSLNAIRTRSRTSDTRDKKCNGLRRLLVEEKLE